MNIAQIKTALSKHRRYYFDTNNETYCFNRNSEKQYQVDMNV